MKLTRYFDCTLDYLADDNIDIHSEVFKNRSLFLKVSAVFSPQEIQMIEKYRVLDGRGRKTVDILIASQLEIIASESVNKK